MKFAIAYRLHGGEWGINSYYPTAEAAHEAARLLPKPNSVILRLYPGKSPYVMGVREDSMKNDFSRNTLVS